MPRKQTNSGGLGAAYSLGFEMVCAVAGCALFGYWFDRHFHSDPWGVVVGLIIGLVGGSYNLIRGASRTLQSGAKRAVSLPPGRQVAATGKTAEGASGSADPAGRTDRLDDRADRDR
jgi:hypothetical protein